MQDLIGGLLSTLGDDLSALGSAVGADRDATSRAITAALPALLGAMARNADKGGAEALAGALDRDHDGSVLDNLGGLFAAGNSAGGAAILGHVLGQREPAVAANVARNSGLDLSTVQKLLPLLAPLVLGYLGRTKRQSGLDAGGLASLLAGASSQMEGQAPGLLSGLLDADGDGDISDDVAKLGSSLLGGFLKR